MPDDSGRLDNEDVTLILRRFSTAARHLSQRPRDDKKALGYQIEDEYDVQDLLYAILKLTILDLEREDPVSKTAGDSGRVDVCSDSRGIVIEIKYAKTSKRASDIPRECRERIILYSKWPSLRHLIFFLYDPSSHLNDPDNIIQDLTFPAFQCNDKKYCVTTIISPFQVGTAQQSSRLAAAILPQSQILAHLNEPNENLMFAIRQPVYTKDYKGIIIPIEMSNTSNQPNTIASVSIKLGDRVYEPCSPPPGLLGPDDWLDRQNIRLGGWDFVSGAWFFGAGIVGQPIEIESRTPIVLRVLPVRGNRLEATLLVIPLADLKEQSNADIPSS